MAQHTTVPQLLRCHSPKHGRMARRVESGPRRGLRVWQGAPPYRGLQGLQLYYMRDGRSSVKALLAAWPCGRCQHRRARAPGMGHAVKVQGLCGCNGGISILCPAFARVGTHGRQKPIRQEYRSFCGAHEDLASERSFGQGNTLATKGFFDSLLAAGWLCRPAREPH